MTRRLASSMALVISACLCVARASAQAQPETPSAEPPVTTPAETPPDDGELPSLDELLGLPAKPGDMLDDPTKTDLDRLLSGGEIGDAFRQAVTLMGDVARRMQDGGDAGLTTQRMQQTILRRLDQLISSMEQQQQQQQQQSSSQQQQQQNQSSKQVPSQQQSERNDEQRGDNTGQTQLPARRDGGLNPAPESTRAAWGNLPERVREMLVQGSTDRFSSMYDAMTRSYYRKLAEEAKPQ